MTAPLTPFGIEAAAERIRLRLERSAQDIVAIGVDLIAVRDAIGAEQFQGWIGEQFGMSRTTAYRFISVAERFPNPIVGLTPTALYELAAPSTPDEVVAEVKEKAAKGELVNAAEVRRLRSENERLQAEKDSAATASKRLAREVSDLRGQLEEAGEAQIIEAEPDYSAQITAALSYFGALPIPVREAVWQAYATPYARARTIEHTDSVADPIVAYADEEKPDATDFSDAEHQRPEPGERAATESAQGEATGADPSTGGNGSEGHRGGGEAESEEPGPAGEGEDPFGSLNYDKPGFEAIPRGLLRDPENPLAKLGGGIA